MNLPYHVKGNRGKKSGQKGKKRVLGNSLVVKKHPYDWPTYLCGDFVQAKKPPEVTREVPVTKE